MRPKKDERWRARAIEIAVNDRDRRLSAEAIARQIKKEGGDVSHRTVTRWIAGKRPKKEVQKPLVERTEDDPVSYRYFSYPESMIQGFLPWEASEAALELVRYVIGLVPKQFKSDMGVGIMLPTNLEVLWFWRVTLCTPDCEVAKRADIASILYQVDRGMLPASQAPDWYKESFWRLVYEPWKSQAADKSYRAAQESKWIPKSLRVTPENYKEKSR